MHRPALTLAVSFASGIILGEMLAIEEFLPAAVLAVMCAFAAVIMRGGRNSLAAALLAALFSGVFAYSNREMCMRCGDLPRRLGEGSARVEVRGVITRAPRWEPAKDEQGRRRVFRGDAVISLVALHAGEGWIPAHGLVRVKISAEQTLDLASGDMVHFFGILGRIRGPTNPGQFDGRAFWHRRGVDYSLTVSDASFIKILERGKAAGMRRVIEKVRAALRRGLEIGVRDCPEHRIILAMILGYRERMDDELTMPFRLTNTIHILAISGLHVGFFYLVVRGVLAALRVPTRYGSLLAVPLIAAYAAVTGAAIPVLRACVMFTALLAAPFVSRERDALNALGVAALELLVVNPLHLFETGFQLSFAAVLAILLISPGLISLMHHAWPCGPLPGQLLITGRQRAGWRFGKCAVQLLGTSLAAWIGLAPLVASSFNLVSLFGVAANALVIPAGLAIVCLGFAGAVCGLFLPPIAAVINRLNCLVVWLMLGGIRALSSLPFAWVPIASTGTLRLVCAYGALGAATGALLGRLRSASRWVLLCAAAVVLLLLLIPSGGNPLLTAVFLDVGEGDATYIEFPGGENMLIDGGPESSPPAGRSVLIPFLRHRGRRKIDTVLLTHPHADHISGLFDVLSRCEVGALVVAEWGEAPEVYLRLLDMARSRGVEVRRVSRGDCIFRGPAVRVAVLNPGDRLHSGTRSDLNNNSIALRITYGRVNILICADMEEEAEKELCASGLPLRADILRVGHHGGSTSGTADIIKRAAPRWAVISAGRRNRFDHPSPDAIARLREAGCAVFRTDLHGAVTLTTDGREINIAAFSR